MKGLVYQLFKGEDGIYLLVKKCSVGTRPIRIEDLYNELAQRNISYDKNMIYSCFTAANEEKVKIADLVENQIYSVILALELESDKMKAILKVYPSLDNSTLELKDLQEFLKQNGIKAGIKNELFSEILKQSNLTYQERVIAEGINSVDGVDAKLNFLFQKEGKELKPMELDDGSVDYYNLNLIDIVKPGMTLVEKRPPQEGRNGQNVLGEEIMAKPGKDLKLPSGINTEINEDNTKLTAKVEGYVSFVNNKVNVYPNFEVKGDVDFNTGNIDFPGNVTIKGNVNSTFSVNAKGNVEIFGNLAGFVSASGNLTVKKGIVQGKAKVEGDIIVRYIENGIAISNSDIIVGEVIMHSTVKARNRISVSGKKGLIVGGNISAGKEITAKNIGTLMGTKTILEVGNLHDTASYNLVCSKIKALQKNLIDHQKTFEILQSMEEQGKLSSTKKDLFLRVKQALNQIEIELDELSQQRNEFENYSDEIRDVFVKATDTMYSGVIINIGKYNYEIYEDKYRMMFRIEDYEIRGINL